MKKILLLVIIFTIAISSVAFAKNEIEIKVYVDGELVVFPDQKPFVDENGRTLVPVRFPAEKFGAEVEWENSERRVDIKHYEKEREIKLWIGSSEYTVNKEVKNMDTEAVLINERTMIPIRFVAEALDVRVDWRQTEGKGYVFNFTKGQSKEQMEKVMDEIVKKDNTQTTPENSNEQINKTVRWAKGKGFNVSEGVYLGNNEIMVMNNKDNFVLKISFKENGFDILSFEENKKFELAKEIAKELGIGNIENILNEYFNSNNKREFETEKMDLYIEGGKLENSSLLINSLNK